MRKRIFYLGVLLVVLTLLSLMSFTNEHDPLHGRIFTTSLSETKHGTVAKKVIADQLTFKNGRLRSDFLNKKFGYKWLRYRINKDSVYVDFTNTEVRSLDVEAIITNDKNETVYINFVTCEWDLDGTIKITKNDRLKKYYDMAGREKGGKPKKKRNEKKGQPIFEILK